MHSLTPESAQLHETSEIEFLHTEIPAQYLQYVANICFLNVIKVVERLLKIDNVWQLAYSFIVKNSNRLFKRDL